ncbi:MAG: acetate--CoA ligase family protein [Cycloclasticus sp.]
MSLKALFEPASVAVIGASSNPARIGGRPIDYYLKAGFKGRIYPVNPNRDEVQGLKAYSDIASIPGTVDLAILAISAKMVADALTACGEKGVKAIALFSAGFSEIGHSGDALQQQVDDIAKRYGMRILGPNCLGLYNGDIGNCPTFTSGLEGGFPKAGRVGLITQSGAYGTHLLTMAKSRHLGVSKWISTGNESDLTVAECLEYLIDSDTVDVVGCYMEGVKKPDILIRALKKARTAGKAVVIMKVGVSEVGSEAVQSHTASLTGSDASFQALLDQYGAQRARTTEQMFDILYAFSVSPRAKGDQLGILTVSGGAGVLMADAAEEQGIPVPAMPQVTQDRLIERNPLCSPRNPVDITGNALNDFSLVSENLMAMIDEGHYDLLVAFFTSWLSSPAHGEKLFNALSDGIKGRNKPFAVIGQTTEEVKEKYESVGIMVFEDPSRAVVALSALAKFNTTFNQSDREDGEIPDIGDIVLPVEKIGEAEAKSLIERAGIPIPKEELVTGAQEACDSAIKIGFPVVMKIVSPDIAHKSEVGGVALNLMSGKAVREAAELMLKTIREKEPNAKIEGLLISPMIGDGVDFIIGTQRDPVMGPIIMVGLGGVYTEILKDVRLSLAPVSTERALSMLQSLRGAAIFQGARGQQSINLNAAADAISRLSVLAVNNVSHISSIEVNPLRATNNNVIALDALIISNE